MYYLRWIDLWIMVYLKRNIWHKNLIANANFVHVYEYFNWFFLLSLFDIDFEVSNSLVYM